jgi:chromosome partitioning protein
MILTVGNTKGGVGKTTLALNIAIERARQGQDVLFVDADEQRTASDFFALRSDRLGDPGVTHVALSGLAVRKQTARMSPKYDDVVIDVGGRDTTALRAALVVADCVLVPSQPRSFDLWALEIMASLIRDAIAINDALRAFAILCRADPQGADNAEAARTLAGVEGLTYLDTPIVMRKAWANASSLGLGVAEPRRCDVKARDELWACVGALYAVDPYAVIPLRGVA